MKKTIDISIVIPAYNEETNIRLGAIDKVLRFLDRQTYAWEVLFVDDGSSDRTGELLEQYSKGNAKLHVIHNPHQGKAATVITGMLSAHGEVVLFTDLDQATPLSESERILPWFHKGYDVVIGSRNSRREGAPFLRKIMARGFMFLRSTILGLHGIVDTQCGFKAFRRVCAQDIFQRLQVYREGKEVSGSMVTAGFDIEVLFVAKLLGYKIKEVPVEWHYVETRRVNPIKDSVQGIRDILIIRYNSMNNKYTNKS